MTRRELLSALTFTIATARPSQATYVIASPCAVPGRRYPACLAKYTEEELRKPEQLLKKLQATELLKRLQATADGTAKSAKPSGGLRQTGQGVEVPIDEAEIRTILQALLFGLSNYDKKVFVDSTDLAKDLGLDRTLVVRDLEAAFSIKISDEAARRFTTIGDTINYLKGRRIKVRDHVPPGPVSIIPCVDACPVDCIHPKEADPQFGKTNMVYIDPVQCIDCGACVPACPVSAAFAEDDLPDKWSHYSKINAAFYRR